VNVTVRFTDATGTPLAGRVLARPTGRWHGDEVIVLPVVVEAPLDASGTAVLQLVDGPAYEVADALVGLRQTPWHPYSGGDWPTGHGETL